MIKVDGTFKFYQNTNEFKFGKVTEIMQSNQEAYKYIGYAKSNRTFSNIFLGFGITFFGYGVLSGISNAVEKEESSYLIAGTVTGIVVGGALIGISIPMRNAYKKKAKKAIEIYNQGPGISKINPSELKFGISSNGLGFTLHF